MRSDNDVDKFRRLRSGKTPNEPVTPKACENCGEEIAGARAKRYLRLWYCLQCHDRIVNGRVTVLPPLFVSDVRHER